MWLFPGLLLSMVLGNQPWSIAQLIGQSAGWLNIASALIIMAEHFTSKIWTLFLFLSILYIRILRNFYGSYEIELAYITLISVLFCYAGAILIHKYKKLVYFQAMVICVINLALMILQVTGVGAWAGDCWGKQRDLKDSRPRFSVRIVVFRAKAYLGQVTKPRQPDVSFFPRASCPSVICFLSFPSVAPNSARRSNLSGDFIRWSLSNRSKPETPN